MRPAKTKSNQEAGQTAPWAVFAFDLISPEPKLKSFTSMIPQKKTPESSSRVLTDHAGASPVASALGIRSGANPRGRLQLNTLPNTRPFGPELSILPETCHFYFALIGRLKFQPALTFPAEWRYTRTA
jgi:hypothetical protein